jgi:A/G-specific adenine glycosylase
MLQQTQVKTVLPYWERWMRAIPDVRTLAMARSQTLHKLWEGLGYYTRVRNMQKAARMMMAKHGGTFPEKFDDVLALPGVGRYTAGAICSIAFNQPTPIVDGNVARVLARLFGIEGDVRRGEVREALWELAGRLVKGANSRRSNRPDRPDGSDEMRCSQLNQSLMELGALVCTPKGPRCEVCPIAKHCLALRESRVEELPVTGARQQTTQRRFVAVVMENKGRFFVRQRPAGVVNGHLWEFPNAEVGLESASRSEAKRMLGENGIVLAPFCVVRHSITRYRITMDVFRAEGELANEWRNTNGYGRWVERKRLLGLPFTSAHKKVIERLMGQVRGRE